MSEYKLGIVTSTSGGVFVRFDGETTASAKKYKRLANYSPTVSDRVLLVKVGGTYVILGKVI